MDSKTKYKDLVLKTLMKDLSNYLPEYNPYFNSFVWLGKDLNWVFDYDIKSKTLIWFYEWGENFKSSLCLDDNEFETLITEYVKTQLKKKESFNVEILKVQHGRMT